jgi:hypothetical protein
MRADILAFLNSNMVSAEANLARAQRQFGHMSPEQLADEYRESGWTCDEVFNKCKGRATIARDMKTWFEANTKEK